MSVDSLPSPTRTPSIQSESVSSLQTSPSSSHKFRIYHGKVDVELLFFTEKADLATHGHMVSEQHMEEEAATTNADENYRRDKKVSNYNNNQAIIFYCISGED